MNPDLILTRAAAFLFQNDAIISAVGYGFMAIGGLCALTQLVAELFGHPQPRGGRRAFACLSWMTMLLYIADYLLNPAQNGAALYGAGIRLNYLKALLLFRMAAFSAYAAAVLALSALALLFAPLHARRRTPGSPRPLAPGYFFRALVMLAVALAFLSLNWGKQP